MLFNHARWFLPFVVNAGVLLTFAGCDETASDPATDAATPPDSADAGAPRDSGNASPSAGRGGSPESGSGGSQSAGTDAGSTSAGTGGTAASGATASSELSAAERASVLFTREEEKLARDVYTKLQASDHVFANIAASEQMHMDAVATLQARYALPDPAEGKAAGAFEDATLQALYDRLIEEGSASQTAAIQAGIEIEELDIRDITEASADVTHADIQRVYAQLTRGSRNHLRAFYSRLTALGGSYTPKYLEPAVFEEIATGSIERGP